VPENVKLQSSREDKVQGFSIKSMTSLHERIAEQLNKILIGENEVPGWVTYGHTILCQKDVLIGNAGENYRPITCLPPVWRLLTGEIAEEMNAYLKGENLLPSEQKGSKRKSRGTDDQLLIDKVVLKDCRKRHTNTAMAWRDYKKACDFVPHSWINQCMELMGIVENLRELLVKSKQKWKLSFTSNGNGLGDVKVNRGIFQGDSLSSLLFLLCMMQVSLALRTVKVGYEWGKKEFSLNHLLSMDDLKLYRKSE